MMLIEASNWLSFNIYFTPKTLIGSITDYLKWYFKFLKDILRPFLLDHKHSIKYVYFGDYLYKKPIDKMIINNYDINLWIDGLNNLRDQNLLSQDDIRHFQESIRYIRLRFFIDNNHRDSIIDDFAKQIENVDYILGFELVEYNVIEDLGKRFSSRKDEWKNTSEQLERLKKFIAYWDSICRYILTIVTNDYYLDFENVEIEGILHLGFHSLGSNLAVEKCQNCGDILYFMSNYQPICHFRCNCGIIHRILQHL